MLIFPPIVNQGMDLLRITFLVDIKSKNEQIQLVKSSMVLIIATSHANRLGIIKQTKNEMSGIHRTTSA
jgi:hypothetical protein